MDWNDYKEQFEREALSLGRSNEFAARWLKYAKRLFDQDLPIVYTFAHLSQLLGFEERALRDALDDVGQQYFSFEIPKKKAGYRRIDQPRDSLRGIQKWVLTQILDRCAPHDAAMAFRRGRSIKGNAMPHVCKPMVLSLDLRNFFPSVSRTTVSEIFEELGYASEVATALTSMTTLDGGLPQGAPTSPSLSNLAMRRLDEQITQYARKRHLTYTRYADDITISGRFRTGQVIGAVRRMVLAFGFRLNESKTRLMRGHERQEVTGVVINTHAQAPREVRRRLRQELYFIDRFGLEEHTERVGSLYANRLDHLRGLGEHVRFLNPADRDALALRHALGPAQLRSRP